MHVALKPSVPAEDIRLYGPHVITIASVSITTDALRRRRVRSRMRTRLALTQRRGSDEERRGTHRSVDRPIDVLASATAQAQARANSGKDCSRRVARYFYQIQAELHCMRAPFSTLEYPRCRSCRIASQRVDG